MDVLSYVFSSPSNDEKRLKHLLVIPLSVWKCRSDYSVDYYYSVRGVSIPDPATMQRYDGLELLLVSLNWAVNRDKVRTTP